MITALACAPWVAVDVEGQTDSTVVAGSDTIPVFHLEPLEVMGRADDLVGIAASASEGRVGMRDIRLRPLLREAELLETVPGMILTQHSGEGKSNQMFVRGFNLDHGTDFQTRVEGMPVNLPTHGHGQGWTDLNFLIPELVDHVEYKLGVYYPEIGDFSGAGGAHVRLRESLDAPLIAVGVGEHGYARTVGGFSTDVGPGRLLVGGEVRGYDGPWSVPQRLRKWSGVGRYGLETGNQRLSFLAMGYRSRWDASDQIPLRLLAERGADRFSQVDSTLGGESDRYSLSAAWRRIAGSSAQRVEVFGIRYGLDLFSNFTYFLDDPERGDQIRQIDQRTIVGANAEHSQRLGTDTSHLLRLGLQTRADLIDDLGLDRTRARSRIATIRADRVTQWSTGVYAGLETRWTRTLRTELGLRGDVFLFDVDSDITANSGRRRDALLSPKASVVLGPWAETELYLSTGFGFHSNDARGTTITVDPATGQPVERVDPLVPAFGNEVGLRTNPAEGWRSTVALWSLALESELLFVGDAGTTEASDGSRRLGVSWTNFYRPASRLTLELDVSATNARLTGARAGSDRIPGALERVVTGGATWESPGGAFAAVRLRNLGGYPLVESGSVRARSSTLLNGSVGYAHDKMLFTVSVMNLSDADASDIQYYYASRLPGEPDGGVDDVHFHPVEPRQLRLSVSWGR